MDCISQIEEEIDTYIKDEGLTTPKTLKVILNRTYITKYSGISASSVCLHLISKYKGLPWPELCCDSAITIILFIGRKE